MTTDEVRELARKMESLSVMARFPSDATACRDAAAILERLADDKLADKTAKSRSAREEDYVVPREEWVDAIGFYREVLLMEEVQHGG